MTILAFPLETSPSPFTAISGASIEGNFTTSPAQAAPSSVFITNLNVRPALQLNVPVTINSFIDIVSVDEESCGPCFPICINRTYDIVEPLGTVTFYGEQPRHQVFLNVPTILNVRDDKNYVFTAPVTTTVQQPFWS